MTEFSFSSIPNNTHAQWWKDPCLRKNVLHCFGCCLCVFYLGFDQSLLTGLQALPSWAAYFGAPKGNDLGLISASIFLPSIVTAFVGDWIAYRFGRRIAVWTGSVLIIIGALVNGLANSKGMFIGGRVILGSGGAITKVGAPALLHEIAHPRLRGTIGAFYYTFYYVGSLTSASLCIAGLYINGNWGWRFPCIFQVVGPMLVIGFTLTAPESPRYLIKNNKNDKARAVLAKYHANGDSADPLVEWEYQEISSALEAEAMLPKTEYLDFLRTAGNRRRLLAVVSLAFGTNWVGNGLVSYYLSPVLRSVGIAKPLNITAINAGLAAWNLCLAQYAASKVEVWGRRPLFFASIIGMFCSYVVVMALSATFAEKGNQAAGIAVVPFLFFFYGFYDIAWTPLPYHYSTEILPYAMRTKGLAIFTSTQNIGNAFNQFVNPIALEQIQWRYYAVYLGVLAFYLTLAYFFYYETKGLSLEEIGTVFDYGRKEGRDRLAEMLREREQQRNMEPRDLDSDVKGGTAHVDRV